MALLYTHVANSAISSYNYCLFVPFTERPLNVSQEIVAGEELYDVYNKIAWHKKVQFVSIISVTFLFMTIVVKISQIISQLISGFYASVITATTDIFTLLLVISLTFLFQQIFGLHTAKRNLLEIKLMKI